ncbi:MAG TPA: pectate lyase [Bacteroidales bacterium]|nr:pectate lyase [Bacteroidales bacterium]
MKQAIAIGLCFLLGFFMKLPAQTPAFPGAEGGGRYVTGGRGGTVLFVDNLNDDGPGSLRQAVETEGSRTVLFRVSGNIELKSILSITADNLTLAGQTAPGDGICLRNFGIRVKADNVIIRFIRIRPGDTSGEENDAITGNRNRNILIDHCSFSWAVDEVASFYDNANFTMQWCIISESLFHSVHRKGEHGYGGIWGGLNASFHHNLLSDHSSRNPRFCGPRYSGKPENEKVDFRNNVIYNWGFNSVYGGEEGSYNMVNNYFKPGPATRTNVRHRILNLTQEFFNPGINPDTLHAGWFFIEGNFMEGDPAVTADNWNGGVQYKGINDVMKAKSRLSKPVPGDPVRTSDAKTAYREVLEHAGASMVSDPVDLRVLGEAKSGVEQFGATFALGGKGIIDSQKDVGGWPQLKSLQPPKDSDNDGMPDTWERKNNLNPDRPDQNEHTLDQGYTNIEMYINSLVNHLMGFQ